jgi:hypothetical protein
MRLGAQVRQSIASASPGGFLSRPARTIPWLPRISLSSPLLHRATMSQKSSLPQPARSVSRVLTADSLDYLTPAAFAARLRTEDTAPADVTGRGAAVSGASAPPPRHITLPQGAYIARERGGQPKLKLARRNRAGQELHGSIWERNPACGGVERSSLEQIFLFYNSKLGAGSGDRRNVA